MKIGVLYFVNGERRGDQEKQQPSVQGKEPQTNSTSVRCQGYGSGIKPGISTSLLAAGGTCGTILAPQDWSNTLTGSHGGMSRKHPFSCEIRDRPLPWSYCKILFLICLGANSLSRGRLWKFFECKAKKFSFSPMRTQAPISSDFLATLSSTNWVAQKFWALQATVLLQFIWTDIFLSHFPFLSPLWYFVQYILAEV